MATRCGSEAYAAPELVTGTGGGGGGRGVYDARRTDAWACGVVLYALVGRQLPFGEGVAVGGGATGGAAGRRGGSRIGGERGIEIGHGGKVERRHWLMRIARGEWEWPGEGDGDGDGEEGVERDTDHRETLVGPKLVKLRGARRIVSRLLVRDPRKRARIGDLWDDVWMSGGEDEVWRHEKEDEQEYQRQQESQALSVSRPMPMSSSVPAMALLAEDAPMHRGYPEDERSMLMKPSSSWSFCGEFGEGESQDADMRFYDEPTGLEGFSGEFDYSSRHIRNPGECGEEEEEEEEEECEQGYLFDHEGIDSITRQEVI